MSLRPISYFVGFLLLAVLSVRAQSVLIEKRRLTSTEGLPQSFVSGIVQDRAGFIWTATREGLARYDGRRFKVFRHKVNDPNSLASNIIATLYIDGDDQLWIQYENGAIDVFNAHTEHLYHFSDDPVFRPTFSNIKNINAIVSPKKHIYWMISDNGGIFIADLKNKKLLFYSPSGLGLGKKHITGIETSGGNIVLSTDSAIVTVSTAGKIRSTIPFTFKNPNIFDPSRTWKDTSPIIRKNGDMVILDKGRVIIYKKASHSFSVLPLAESKSYVQPSRTFDKQGNIWFGSNQSVFMLTTDSRLIPKPIFSAPGEVARNMLIDRSDVLWIGTNGYNLRQFDLRLPRMPAKSYTTNFFIDILHRELNVPEAEIQRSPLAAARTPYLFRSARDKHGKIWMSVAGADEIPAPNLCYYQQGHLISDPWHYADTISGGHRNLSALAVSGNGQLWAVDDKLHLIRLDTTERIATTVSQIPIRGMKEVYEIYSLLVEGEHIFYITTSIGFFRFDLRTKVNLSYGKMLPGAEFTMLLSDPSTPGILWVGTKGDGLIRMDPSRRKFRLYSIEDSLPNNTIYAIQGKKGRLWCSTNKGIFSFGLKDARIQSYTMTDGLPVDEFNRFHYFETPDGRLAFGGTEGYTLFLPEAITHDNFSPPTVLTGIRINNKPADYGEPDSPFGEAINALDTLQLSYRQNFLELDFAALEYNITGKLNYRYMMFGLDGKWIDAGTNNRATYTNLSPGTYQFRVNATNSAGQWSKKHRQLTIIIWPPFYQTWWFITALGILVTAAAYLLLKQRIARIRQRDQKKHELEIEMIELEAQALRAQMNPHFIFNCLSSIKSLIQENANQQAISYLSTFSRLIRGQLGNELQEITLEEEMSTCRLYLDMEKLRFGDKVRYSFLIGPGIEPKRILVPPLFLQPLIENAIWHGILALEHGGEIVVRIDSDQQYIICRVEDNGIGMTASRARKLKSNNTNESKGIVLIENRLRVFNVRNETQSNISIYSQPEGKVGTIVEVKFLKT